jgi:hypothetical protein
MPVALKLWFAGSARNSREFCGFKYEHHHEIAMQWKCKETISEYRIFVRKHLVKNELRRAWEDSLKRLLAK